LRDATPDKVAEAEAAGKPHVIRQRVPRGQKVVIEDFIRGRSSSTPTTSRTRWWIKADGMPTYHFAAIVDDHLMEITHIVRAKNGSRPPDPALLFDHFGWERPIFVTAPHSRARRQEAVKAPWRARVLAYAAEGSSNPPSKLIASADGLPKTNAEVLSEEELVPPSIFGGCNPSPANSIWRTSLAERHMIRNMPPSGFSRPARLHQPPLHHRVLGHFTEDGPHALQAADRREADPARLRRIAEAAEKDQPYVLPRSGRAERVQTLADFGEAMEFFLVEEPPHGHEHS